MPRIPSLTPKQVQRILVANEFKHVDWRGSHAFFRKNALLITVPMHAKELPRGLLIAIIKQSRIPREKFLGGRSRPPEAV